MQNNSTKSISILVIGATGLIGSSIFKYLSGNANFTVFGTIRNPLDQRFYPDSLNKRLITNLQASDVHKWNKVLNKIKPNVVINCLGITKHLEGGNDPLVTIPINAYFPHYLNILCQEYGTRLIHISSDCVFSGSRGSYLEGDIPDAEDFYGRSKALGEVSQGPAITLRTSTIGHELHGALGLLDWFLCQKGSCQGFKKPIFLGSQQLSWPKLSRDMLSLDHNCTVCITLELTKSQNLIY